jgi:hypothetical protein
MIHRDMIERWVKLERSKLIDKFPDNPALAYAALVGILESKLVYVAMGGSARDIALELIEEDLKEVA